MEKQSKKELLVVVERQGDQLKRYEARLRDVVQAYKGLQKEKIALEKSLRVLSTGTNVDSAERDSNVDESTKEESENTVQENASDGSKLPQSQEFKSEQTEEEQDVPGDQLGLQAQVETLREALDTIMEQKTKMESSFQADKKKYLHELEVKEESFTREREAFDKQKETMLRDIQELRIRTRGEQQARETDQNDHAMMLKEMQVLVAKERLAREELQNKIEYLETSLTEKEALKKSDDEWTVILGDSTAASSSDKGIQVSDTSSMIQKLEEEMKKIKLQLEKDILSEQQRANDAEHKASLVAKAEEKRVADLEAKLSELSNVVGKYERLRSHDQMEIKKLKDRLHMFTTTHKDDVMSDNRNVESDLNLDNENVNEVFRKLKDVLRFQFQNQEHFPESNDLGFSRADLECILQNDPAHKACKEELRQLKDEFECYKAKAQVMRKSRLESETDSNNKDSEKLRNQIKDLKRAVESLQKDLGDKDSEIDILQERLACEKMDLQKLHNSELESERTVYSAKMHELEKQMHNQRTRTMSLINEKDCEIERLKKKVAKEHPGSPSVHRTNAAMLSRKPSSSDEAVNELLLQSSPSPLVHFAQEQAYCEAEFMLLKKQRRELEDSMHEIRLREEQASEQVELLKEEVRKLERNCSRENANLEYLKNVILRYLLTDSESVRQQMVAAIATILEFSPQELLRVRHTARGWWGK